MPPPGPACPPWPTFPPLRALDQGLDTGLHLPPRCPFLGWLGESAQLPLQEGHQGGRRSWPTGLWPGLGGRREDACLSGFSPSGAEATSCPREVLWGTFVPYTEPAS